ncbi:MAG: 2-octaprenyl-6-methoxyphenyl hydroxylase [Aeromonadales bacterium]|nr:2-octaprenyl-6-methoxyphenyl hydroxylase [Aeromonadales bacterium]
MTHYDVVINGGGMAGSVLALGLSQLRNASGEELRIALIERTTPTFGQHPGFDARSIALAAHSRTLLEQLGLWSAFAPLVTPITHIQVSDQGHVGQLPMRAKDYNVDALGYVVELSSAGEALYRKLQQIKNITLYLGTEIVQFEQQLAQVEIQLSDHRALSATLLVAADGSQSIVSQQLNLARRQFDYQQSAIIANITTALPHQGAAFERFTSEGPVALLPMSEGRSSLVWCVGADRAQSLMTLDAAAFIKELQHAFGYRLGKITQVGARHHYPLLLDEVVRPWHHRVVLVGNAAHLLHPIAGQGFNLGLRDVAALIKQVNQALAQQQDIGAYGSLSGYREGRVADQHTIVTATTALTLVFSNSDPLLAVARNMGLMALAVCPLLKNKLAWRAMGKE